MREELGVESDLIPGIALGFGGGLGRRGLVCGALNGGVMAIGLRYGPIQEKDAVYAQVLELCHRFEKRHGSALCCDLTGCDLTNPEDRQRWSDSGGHEKCSQFVSTAVEILLDLLGE